MLIAGICWTAFWPSEAVPLFFVTFLLLAQHPFGRQRESYHSLDAMLRLLHDRSIPRPDPAETKDTCQFLAEQLTMKALPFYPHQLIMLADVLQTTELTHLRLLSLNACVPSGSMMRWMSLSRPAFPTTGSQDDQHAGAGDRVDYWILRQATPILPPQSFAGTLGQQSPASALLLPSMRRAEGSGRLS